jgi:hypothetical protein
LPWSRLVAIEPGCQALLEEARQTQRDYRRRYDLQPVYYRQFKPQVPARTKSDARSPLLTPSLIYDLLYEKICSALGVGCGRESPFKELEAIHQGRDRFTGKLPDMAFDE